MNGIWAGIGGTVLGLFSAMMAMVIGRRCRSETRSVMFSAAEDFRAARSPGIEQSVLVLAAARSFAVGVGLLVAYAGVGALWGLPRLEPGVILGFAGALFGGSCAAVARRMS